MNILLIFIFYLLQNSFIHGQPSYSHSLIPFFIPHLTRILNRHINMLYHIFYL